MNAPTRDQLVELELDYTRHEIWVEIPRGIEQVYAGSEATGASELVDLSLYLREDLEEKMGQIKRVLSCHNRPSTRE